MRWLLTGCVLLQIATSAGAETVVPLFTSRSSVQARVDALTQPGLRKINVMTYKFRADRVGLAYIAMLREAARAGARVRFVYDAYGSDMPKALLALLAQEENFEVRVYRPPRWTRASIRHPIEALKTLNERLHPKLMTINGRKAFVGSSNMTEQYPLTLRKRRPRRRDKQFKDKDIYVEGDVVQEMDEFFERMWRGRNLEPIDIPDRVSASFQSKMNLLESKIQKMHVESEELIGSKEWRSNGSEGSKLNFVADQMGENQPGKIPYVHDRALNLIREANHSISIESPYVILNEKIFEELKKASQRGVKIRIFTVDPRRSDVKAAGELFSYDLPLLAKMGASVYVYEGFAIPHGKVISIDGFKTLLGSYNLDQRSARYNSEIGVVIESEAFAGDFEEEFSYSIKNSKTVVDSGKVHWKKLMGSGPGSCLAALTGNRSIIRTPSEPGGNLNFYMQFIRPYF